MNCPRGRRAAKPDIFEDEAIKEDFELAESAAREGSKLAVNYLQLTKIYTPQVEDVNLNDVLRKTAADVRVFAADHSAWPVEVRPELDAAVTVKRLDPEQLRMAFFNLCKNAVALAEFKMRMPCCAHQLRGWPPHRIDITANGRHARDAKNLFTAQDKKQAALAWARPL